MEKREEEKRQTEAAIVNWHKDQSFFVFLLQLVDMQWK